MRQDRKSNARKPYDPPIPSSDHPWPGGASWLLSAALVATLAGIVWLTGCTAPAEKRDLPAPPRLTPASLVEPLVLGADVSAGAGLRVNLATVLEAGLKCPNHILDRSHQGLFVAPEATGQKLVEDAARLVPTVVIAPDFLFWFVHCHETPAARSAALTQGLFLLEMFHCPVFAGNLPALVHRAGHDKNGAALPVIPVPEPERQALNHRIALWAQKKDLRFVLPVSDWYETFQAGRPFQLGSRTFHFRASHWVKTNGWHLTENGLIALGLFCLESLSGSLPDLRSLDDKDLDLVTDYRELAGRVLHQNGAGSSRSTHATRQALLQEIESRLVTVPPQAFVMGSEEVGPRHRVSLAAFRISATEVTQAQWEAVMAGWQKVVSMTLDDRTGQTLENRATNPSLNQGRDGLPVDNVTWYDCQEFLRRLNDLAGLTGADRYRLPTEAEWECACRADTSTRFFFGPDPLHLGEYAWFVGNTARTQPVGQLRPNAWRLYDMSGNVAEWCEDYFAPYPARPVRNPPGPAQGKTRVVRGGSIQRGKPLDDVPGAWACQSAARQAVTPDDAADWLGFRLVRPVR